jgi:hypothetical protein
VTLAVKPHIDLGFVYLKRGSKKGGWREGGEKKHHEAAKEEGARARQKRAPYLFDFRRINIYFIFCRTNSVRDLIFI